MYDILQFFNLKGQQDLSQSKLTPQLKQPQLEVCNHVFPENEGKAPAKNDIQSGATTLLLDGAAISMNKDLNRLGLLWLQLPVVEYFIHSKPKCSYIFSNKAEYRFDYIARCV